LAIVAHSLTINHANVACTTRDLLSNVEVVVDRVNAINNLIVVYRVLYSTRAATWLLLQLIKHLSGRSKRGTAAI